MIMRITHVAFPLSVILFLHLLVMFMIQPSVFSHPVGGGGVEFLAQLQGCGKGDTLKGVNQLKQYLQRYGYLDNHADAAAQHDDEFDQVVESAVKTYQLNYHLNTTGILDMQTIKQMMKPRCGVPDIINGTTRMESGKNKKLTVSHYAFFPGYPRWPPTETHLTYTFGSRVDEVVGLDTLRPVISRAFEKWAAASSFRFTFEEAQPGTKANLLIGFESGDHGDRYSFDGRGGILAHAFPPTVGLLHYDADENWSTNPNQNEIDLESVGLHEIGHLLGLGHSGDPEAVMHSGIGAGELRRHLNTDDVQGIRALYNY